MVCVFARPAPAELLNLYYNASSLCQVCEGAVGDAARVDGAQHAQLEQRRHRTFPRQYICVINAATSGVKIQYRPQSIDLSMYAAANIGAQWYRLEAAWCATRLDKEGGNGVSC